MGGRVRIRKREMTEETLTEEKEMSSEGGETDQKEEKVHVINIHRVLR